MTKMDVDLTSNWETCFYPRQHVAMSMVFNLSSNITGIAYCPKCFTDSAAPANEDIEW
jgi:hypothetical protein